MSASSYAAKHVYAFTFSVVPAYSEAYKLQHLSYSFFLCLGRCSIVVCLVPLDSILFVSLPLCRSKKTYNRVHNAASSLSVCKFSNHVAKCSKAVGMKDRSHSYLACVIKIAILNSLEQPYITLLNLRNVIWRPNI